MNERIKQLLYDHRIYDGRCGDTQGIMTCAKTLNEFAQSIVRECASQARQKAKIIKTKTETYSDDVGEMSVGLSVAWQFEVFAQEIEEYFRSEL